MECCSNLYFGLCHDVHNCRQNESQRLTAARLRNAEDITSLQGDRPSLRLDRRRHLELRVGENRVDEITREARLFESGYGPRHVVPIGSNIVFRHKLAVLVIAPGTNRLGLLYMSNKVTYRVEVLLAHLGLHGRRQTFLAHIALPVVWHVVSSAVEGLRISVEHRI